jgi:hypothetical protein
VRANLRGGSLTALTALTVLVSAAGAVGAVGAVPARLAPTDGESTPKDQVPRSKMRGASIDLRWLPRTPRDTRGSRASQDR